MKDIHKDRKIPWFPITCLFTLLFVVAICVGSFSLVWGNSNVICFGTPFPTNADVERRAYLKFPRSAGNIEFHTNGVNRKAGCTIWVKFDMQSKDIDGFSSATLVEKLTPKNSFSDTSLYFMQKQGWILTGDYLGGYARSTSDPSVVYTDQWVFADTTNPQTWKIYVVVNKEWL
jgi:hypothetical protein